MKIKCLFLFNVLLFFLVLVCSLFLNRKLDAFCAKSTEEKLYEFLLSISDNYGNVKLNFGMAELARRLKVGRTSLYRDIQSLENKKLIERLGQSFKINK